MTRPGGTWQNWARTERVRPQRIERPPTVEAVRRAIRSAGRHGLPVKAVGSSHSFNGIAAAPGVQLDLSALSGLVRVDGERGRATLLAGTPLHRIPALLAPHRLAMATLGDIDRQTIAGAVSTGTHGTGLGVGGLATQVVGLTIATADGELLTIDDDEDVDLLGGAVIGLGALGVVVDITLQCVPAFDLRTIERPEPLDEVAAEFTSRSRAVAHFEFYWFPHTDRALTKTHTPLAAGETRRPPSPARRWIDDVLVANGIHQAVLTAGRIVPPLVPRINGLSARVWGGRSFSDASHRVLASPRRVRFREVEYAVPLAQLPSVFGGIRDLIDATGWRIEFPLEVRTAAGDDLWLSPAHGREVAYVAVQRYRSAPHRDYFAAAEQIFLAHDGRPHWGKMHTMDAAGLRPRYPRFDDFAALRERLDPARMFRNAYLDRVLGG